MESKDWCRTQKWHRLISWLISFMFSEWKTASNKFMPNGNKKLIGARENCRKELKGNGGKTFEGESRRRIKWLNDLMRNSHAIA